VSCTRPASDATASVRLALSGCWNRLRVKLEVGLCRLSSILLSIFVKKEIGLIYEPDHPPVDHAMHTFFFRLCAIHRLSWHLISRFRSPIHTHHISSSLTPTHLPHLQPDAVHLLTQTEVMLLEPFLERLRLGSLFLLALCTLSPIKSLLQSKQLRKDSPSELQIKPEGRGKR
jgi:hypothetical protein